LGKFLFIYNGQSSPLAPPLSLGFGVFIFNDKDLVSLQFTFIKDKISMLFRNQTMSIMFVAIMFVVINVKGLAIGIICCYNEYPYFIYLFNNSLARLG
jgi:hypothetical protein